MYDRTMVLDILEQIVDATATIKKRDRLLFIVIFTSNGVQYYKNKTMKR